MKHASKLLLALALLLGPAFPARALEVTVKGDLHFNFHWQDKFYNQFTKQEEDTFLSRQRMRFQIDFIADENLKGVLYLHSKNVWWGDQNTGGALDTTSNTLKTRFAYIDWTVPDTSLQLKMGLQLLTLPGVVAGSHVYNTSTAGVSASYQFNENVGINGGWYRPWNSSTNTVHDAWDMFALLLPLTFEKAKLTPWAELSMIGKDVKVEDAGGAVLFENTGEKNSTMYHAGIAADLDVLQQLSVKADFVYGALRNNKGWETDGFMTDLKVTYDFGGGKLTGAAWYGSGSDEKGFRKKDFGYMPSFANSFDHEGGWGYGLSSLGLWGNNPLENGGVITKSGVGTWGVALMVEDVSFVADLSHTLRFLWYQGTNDKDIGVEREHRKDCQRFSGGNVIMTEKDNAYEINFDNRYQVDKNLFLTLDFGILFMDWQSGYKAANEQDDRMWRLGLGAYFNF